MRDRKEAFEACVGYVRSPNANFFLFIGFSMLKRISLTALAIGFFIRVSAFFSDCKCLLVFEKEFIQETSLPRYLIYTTRKSSTIFIRTDFFSLSSISPIFSAEVDSPVCVDFIPWEDFNFSSFFERFFLLCFVVRNKLPPKKSQIHFILSATKFLCNRYLIQI